MTTEVPAFEAIEVDKRYGRTHALDAVSIAFRAGRVHGVAGHNGAGKSTLVRIFAGLERPDSGTLRIGGSGVSFRSPSDSLARGISVIQQSPQICETLTVAENIWLGRQPRASFGGISWAGMKKRAGEHLQRLGLDLDPSAPMETLSMAERQLVEIARAMSRQARILVMDEPTTALTSREVERLFDVVRDLRQRGVAIMFIDHKLDEVMALCDEVTVLRNGSSVAHEQVADTSADALADHIVGHSHRQDQMVEAMPSSPASGTPRLEVRDLGRGTDRGGVSLEVRAGEVVGIAGLVGSGRSSFAKAVAGIEPATKGSILLNGKPTAIRTVADAHRAGIAYVPEDRASYGLLMEMSIEHNVTLARLDGLTRRGLLDHGLEHPLATEYSERMGLIYNNIHQAVSELSGGNQQKVLLARWLAFEPSVLILDEPTQGIDIGVRSEIHRLVRELARGDIAVMVISSEFDELLDVCDRVVVMRDGRIIAERRPDDTSASDLVRIVSAEDGGSGTGPRRNE